MTKPAKKKPKPIKRPGFFKGDPKPEAAKAPHRIPSQPIGFNPSEKWQVYDPQFHPMDFLKHCQEGASPKEICAYWGIASSTLSTWVETHSDFKDHYERGKVAQQAWLIKRARAAAFQDSRSNNGSLVIFLLKNICKFGDEPRTEFEDVADVELDFVYSESKPIKDQSNGSAPSTA